MCLFCSMTRRQAFRGLTAAAVGGMAQRFAAPAIRSPLAAVAGFAALAAADASPRDGDLLSRSFWAKAATARGWSRAGALGPRGSPLGRRRGLRGQQGQRLRVQPRRPSRDRVRPGRRVLALLGRGHRFRQCSRLAHRPR